MGPTLGRCPHRPVKQSRRGEPTIDDVLLTTILPLVGFVLLTAANAFFVAAEFGLVTVDRSEIDRRAAGGDKRAATVRRALRELSFQLSGAQLGITIAALLTGYLAEPALAKLFRPLIEPLAHESTRTVTTILALALATLLSMLFGELVPKNARAGPADVRGARHGGPAADVLGDAANG